MSYRVPRVSYCIERGFVIFIAMITKDEFEKALIIVQEYQKQILIEYQRTKKIAECIVSRDTNIFDFDLSVRALNALKSNGINTAGDLINLRRQKILGYRNIGRTTAQEIIELVQSLIIK